MVRDRRTRSIGFGTVALVALGLVAMGLALRAGLSSDPVVVAAAAPRLASNASPLLTPTVLDAAIVRTAAPTASTVSAAISSPLAADTTRAAPVAGSSSASTASTIAATTFSTTRPAVTVSRITTVATSSAAGASSTTPTASTTSTASATSTASTTSTASATSTSASSSTPNATTVVPTATTPAASTSTPPGSSASSTTAAGPARSVDLTVAASFVGPLVEGRAAFVTITVGNGGPDTAWAPQVSIDLPTAFTEVSSLDPAWSCTVTGSTATCGGSQLEVGTSSVWVLRGTLRSDIVLQSSRTRSAPAVVAPPPLRFRIRCWASAFTSSFYRMVLTVTIWP